VTTVKEKVDLEGRIREGSKGGHGAVTIISSTLLMFWRQQHRRRTATIALLARRPFM